MEKKTFDCVVIGSGPGGYIAAIRAAQRGLSTALIEATEWGGTCLNRGCIPSKTLIASVEILRKVREANQYGISVGDISFDYSAMNQRKNQVVGRIQKGLKGLLTSNKISLFQGFGKFLSPNEIKVTGGENDLILTTKNTIIATGSEPREIPLFLFDRKKIHDSTSLLEMTQLPKKMLIVGAGVIGCEFASLYNMLGVEVTMVELLPSILPMEAKNVSDFLTATFKKRGIRMETGATLQRIEETEKGIIAHLADGQTIEADMALISVGRKYNTDNIGLEKTGVIVAANGSIPTNERMQTNVPSIYAIGDITGKWILAHTASHQGMIAADTMAGFELHMNDRAVPSVIFTHPEIATVGYSLEKAIEAGYDAKVGKFPFQALGKSMAAIETDGFAQLIIERSTGQILGAQVIGHEASTLIAEMAVAIENELTVDSICETIHAHPTLAEAWMEAAFLASGMPLNMPPLKTQ